MMPRRILIIQTLIEAILPTLGYFYWHWDTSFVLLWFALDWLVSYVLTILKTNKRYQYSRQVPEKQMARKRLLLGAGAIILTFSATWFTLPRLESDFSWPERLISFLTYADMGIPQGVILLPLIILNAYTLYNRQFVQFRLYERITMNKLTLALFRESIILPICGIVALVISLIQVYPPEVLLFGSIGGITLYRLTTRY